LSASSKVELSGADYLPVCLRGRKIRETKLEHAASLPVEGGDEVVAHKGDRVLWIHRRAGSSAFDLVAMEPPSLGEQDYLYQHFETDSWARLLPLLHFLQGVSGWTRPRVRAAIMFDDPNLHWKSYGYLNYPDLVAHAGEHNYHASFATIPLDSWYVHPQTAELFRANTDRLSLSIHGNNHTYYELTETPTDEQRLALAAQALQRIERFEAASGLDVSRVMAAPHGACNHAMATALAKTGFEAACISRSSVMIRNPGTQWPLTIGLTPSEFLGDGLPVYPRYNIRWDETYPIFSAFLGQPVVPVAHHEDSANGFELLRETAELINSLGDVQWTDLQTMARTNFLARRDGDILHVKMYSRIVSLLVPEGVSRITIDRPWQAKAEELVLQNGAGMQRVGEDFVAAHPGENMTIESLRHDAVDRAAVNAPRTPLWAIARRQLCEARDRLRPALDRLRTHRNGAAEATHQ
jgi:hypothetical protein